MKLVRGTEGHGRLATYPAAPHKSKQARRENAWMVLDREWKGGGMCDKRAATASLRQYEGVASPANNGGTDSDVSGDIGSVRS